MSEVKSILKAFEILEVIRKAKAPLSLADLFGVLGYPKSTLYRIINTLEGEGYIEKDRGNQKYVLGMKFLHYAYAVSERITIKQMTAPILEKIRDKCMETVYIYTLYKQWRICVDCLPGKSTVRVMVYLGQESPLYAGASGKVMLAYFDSKRLKQYLSETEMIPLTANTIINTDLLQQDLTRIRQRGYAISVGEKDNGVISASAPIRNEKDRVSASLSIAAPVEKQSEIEEYIKLVQEGAKQISTYRITFDDFF